MSSLIGKTIGSFAKDISRALEFDLPTWQREMSMFNFKTKSDLKLWALTSDYVIGGFSKANFENTEQKTARFHGNISLDIPPASRFIKSGYAAIRSKEQKATLFSSQVFDTSIFRYLVLRVKGDKRNYFVNLQTEGPFRSDVFRHPLALKNPGEWEEVKIPFQDFQITNAGREYTEKIEMYRERVRSVGIALMDGKEGPFQLELDWIKALNDDDTMGDRPRF